jgi:hypothetical protein
MTLSNLCQIERNYCHPGETYTDPPASTELKFWARKKGWHLSTNPLSVWLPDLDSNQGPAD